MKQRLAMPLEEAEGLAVQALSYIATDGERLAHFLGATGLAAQEIRAAAADAGFLAGVLEYLAADQRLIVSFSAESGIPPAEIDLARLALGGQWETGAA